MKKIFDLLFSILIIFSLTTTILLFVGKFVYNDINDWIFLFMLTVEVFIILISTYIILNKKEK